MSARPSPIQPDPKKRLHDAPAAAVDYALRPTPLPPVGSLAGAGPSSSLLGHVGGGPRFVPPPPETRLDRSDFSTRPHPHPVPKPPHPPSLPRPKPKPPGAAPLDRLLHASPGAASVGSPASASPYAPPEWERSSYAESPYTSTQLGALNEQTRHPPRYTDSHRHQDAAGPYQVPPVAAGSSHQAAPTLGTNPVEPPPKPPDG